MRKYLYFVVAIIIFGLILIAGIRFLSREDNWICKDGKWVKHGSPTVEKPTTECR